MSLSEASDSVWQRRGGDVLSARAYAFMLCLWVACGIAVSAFGAAMTVNWKPTGVEMIFLIVGTLVSAILGIVVAAKSDNPAVSLFGYALVALPFGLLLGPAVALYTAASVVKVCLVTGGMAIGLGLIGALYPRSLESWGAWLFGALLILILGQFVTIIAGAFGLPIRGAMTVFDWIGVALFSAYVIYDLNRAMRVPKTHDNAVDCALAVYLDIYNLFIRLLSLMGERK